MRVVVAFLFLVLSGAASLAQPPNPLYGEPSDFLGTWNNVELHRNMVLRIVIRPDHDRHVRVIIFGMHDGQPCVFGEYRGSFFVSHYPRDREQDNSAILVKVEREFVHGAVLLRFNGRGEIVSHALLKFLNGDNLYSVERFTMANHGYGPEAGYGAGPDQGYADESYAGPGYAGPGYAGPGRPYYRGY